MCRQRTLLSKEKAHWKARSQGTSLKFADSPGIQVWGDKKLEMLLSEYSMLQTEDETCHPAEHRNSFHSTGSRWEHFCQRLGFCLATGPSV